MVQIFYSFKKKMKGFFSRTKRQIKRRARKPTIVIPGVDTEMGDRYARIPVAVDKR